jgi:hypothetical protein
MIRVTLSNGEHQLAFRHNYVQDWVIKGNNWTERVRPMEGEVRLIPIAEPAMAIEANYWVHPNDNPDKAIGRRIALQKLTDRLENKEDARVIWEAYRASGATIR